jgi:hypothetical protein
VGIEADRSGGTAAAACSRATFGDSGGSTSIDGVPPVLVADPLELSRVAVPSRKAAANPAIATPTATAMRTPMRPA